jgi:hypothetical protein
MDPREERRIKRDKERAIALAAERARKLTAKEPAEEPEAAEEPSEQMSVSVSGGVERVTFHLTPKDFGFYCRSMVVLDIPPTHASEWYSPRIAFFQSSATSNGPQFRHLRNTFFPTLGRANNDDKVPNLPRIAEEEGDFFVKSGLLRDTLSVRNFDPQMRMEQTIPAWIDTLLTEYCETHYPGLLSVSMEIPRDRDDVWYKQTESFIEATEEICLLFDLCINYFTTPWQIAMSIGLSRFFGNGVWVEDDDTEGGKKLRKFNKFAHFIDAKYAYVVEGYKGSIEDADPAYATDKKMCRDFLEENHAQCDFSTIQRLPTVKISGSKLFVFGGRAIATLEVNMNVYNKFYPKPKGGTRKRFKTKRKRSFKTRHQKRR